MKEALIKLLSNIADLFVVKSIVTLTMTAILCLMLMGKFSPQQEFVALYCTAYGSIITYFFTKKDKEEEKEERVTPLTYYQPYDAVYDENNNEIK